MNKDPRVPMAEWVGIVAEAKAKADETGGDPVLDQDLADVQALQRAVASHVTGELTAP